MSDWNGNRNSVWIFQRIKQSSTSGQTRREHCWRNVVGFIITLQITSKCLFMVQPCWRKCGAVNVHHSIGLGPEIVQFWGNVNMVIVDVLAYDTSCFSTFDDVIWQQTWCSGKTGSMAHDRTTITRITTDMYDLEVITLRIRAQEGRCGEKWEKWTRAATNDYFDNRLIGWLFYRLIG